MSVTILRGDCRTVLPTLPDCSIQCCVTSPPYYGLRDYGVAGQIGLEPTPDDYVAEMVAVFREVRRVLRDDGVLWLNIGDSYNAHPGQRKATDAAGAKQQSNNGSVGAPSRSVEGLKPKDLLGIPWLLAFALRADGWYLRSDIIWAKPNPMPESVKGSHFTRHMVTLSDYERLSGLPYTDERPGEDWAGDMPSLSELETPRSKSPLRAKSQGAGYSAGTRGTCGCEGAASSLCCVGTREGQSGQVSEDGEGQGERKAARCCVSDDRARQAQGGRISSGEEGYAGADSAEAEGQRGICQNGEDDGEEAPRLREAQGRDSSRRAIHSGDVAGRGAAASAQVPLLQAAASADDRPRNSGQQGGQAHSGEHRSSVPKLQLQKGQQASPDLLVGCPGCDKCIRHHGYIFHLSAGRPTSAHEHVFLLSKRGAYFYDAGAIAEPQVYPDDAARRTDRGDTGTRHDAGMYSGRAGGRDDGTRNARNVWTIATHPYSGAHFATMPPELAERCIKAGTKPGDTVLDPFGGAGTTGLVADRLNRNATLIELNPAYRTLAAERITADAPLFAGVA